MNTLAASVGGAGEERPCQVIYTISIILIFHRDTMHDTY
jgi:hypothetical protein